MITKEYPNSGLGTKDFVVGEQVIIQDPRGDSSAYRLQRFEVGDICTVQSIGTDIIYFKVNRTGYETKSYPYRFSKLPGKFRLKDFVLHKGNECEVVEVKNKEYIISCGRDRYTAKSDELTLTGRRKLI